MAYVGHHCTAARNSLKVSGMVQEAGASSPNGAQQRELEGIAEEQAPKPADVDAAENGQGSKPADEDPEKAWYKDPLVGCSFWELQILFVLDV